MIALKQIKRKQDPTGSGLAKSGIRIGGIGGALFSGFELVLLPSRVHTRPPANNPSRSRPAASIL